MKIEFLNGFGTLRPVLVASIDGKDRLFILSEVDSNGTPLPWPLASTENVTYPLGFRGK